MRYENLKKEGIIQHPDKGNLDIVIIDGFVETPTIPELSRYSGSISQTLTSDCTDITAVSSESWLKIELLGGSDMDNLHYYALNIDYQANATKDYRKANLIITINAQEHIVEVIQRP
jgi:hypothetical protein